MTARLKRLIAASLVLGLMSACHNAPRKEDEEAAKNTWVCQLAGERVLVRLERGEVRLLMPSGDRINLYEVPSASAAGTRFTNGTIDAVGKGTDLTVSREGGKPEPLQGCTPLVPPKS
ncbi:MAG TPA: hypothetical protein VFC24_16745 [Casimicrobiaceae bacterium]|nr:hypothetical protein [Casimicrobiaceae bacterium]